MRRWVLLALLLGGSSGAAAQDPSTRSGQALAEDRRRLAAAKAASGEAQVRAAALARAAAAERDAARRARTEEQAVAARVRRAEADLAGAEARVRIVDALLARRRGELATRQTPVARLLGALGGLARRPAIVAVAQPGSIDDLVHLRAVLGQVMPVVRARTAALRGELAETRRLRADAVLATRALAESRAALVRERRALAALEASHTGRADTLTRQALASSDRAVALGEAARDIVDRMDQAGDAAAVAAALAALPRPPASRPVATTAPPYQIGRAHV